MAQQRMPLWAAEEIEEEDVDLSLAIGNYGQSAQYDEGVCYWVRRSLLHVLTFNIAQVQQSHMDEPTLIAMQQHMAQQAAFAQIPDVVRMVRVQKTSRSRNDSHILLVHCTLPPSSPRQQSRRNHCGLRKWMEQVDREVLRKNRMARGRNYRALGPRWYVLDFLRANPHF